MHGELKVGIFVKKARRNREGFTLTEVVVASGLLLIAMVPILKGLTISHMVDARIEQKTQSLILAQTKLDDIKARSIYNYDTDFNASSSAVDGNYLCSVVDDRVNGVLRWVLRNITVSVGYDDNGNGELDSGEIEVTLDTLLAKREPTL